MHEVQLQGTAITRHLTPRSMIAALELLARERGRARLIAGGTDLLLELERRQRTTVDTLIDITKIPDLSEISLTPNGMLHIGALVTHNQIVADHSCRRLAAPLAQACREIGSPQLRNQATVVGNLVTASPANDTITPLRALGTTVHAASIHGVRDIDLADFHTGVRENALEPEEMVTGITVRPLGTAQRGVFVKAGLRSAQAISIVHVTVVLEFDHDVVTGASIMLGSVAPTIVSARGAEEFLVGTSLGDDDISRAAVEAANTVSPIDDVRSSAEHRRHILREMVVRAITALRGDVVVSSGKAVLLSGTGTSFRPGGAASDGNVTTRVNGREISAGRAVGMPLLDWLRDEAGPASGVSLTGTKEGCAEGECGACTVLIDGTAVMSCLVPAVRAHGSDILTVEGLGDRTPHDLQQAFVDEGAVQCGYCIPGFLVAGAALLEQSPNPTDDEVLEGFSGNLCRCTGYVKIIDAVRSVARQ